jgi:hypothetical protein
LGVDSVVVWRSVIVMRGRPLLVFCLDGRDGAIEALDQVLGFGVVDGDQRRAIRSAAPKSAGGGVEQQAGPW